MLRTIRFEPCDIFYHSLTFRIAYIFFLQKMNYNLELFTPFIADSGVQIREPIFFFSLKKAASKESKK
jgi:hypothetical protein